MRALVTGGSGFLGKAIVARLLARGDRAGQHNRQIAAKGATGFASAPVAFGRLIYPRIRPGMRRVYQKFNRRCILIAVQNGEGLMILRGIGDQLFTPSRRQSEFKELSNNPLYMFRRSRLLKLGFDLGNVQSGSRGFLF